MSKPDAEVVERIALVFAQHADSFHHRDPFPRPPSNAEWDDFSDTEKASARIAARAALAQIDTDAIRSRSINGI